MFQFGDILWLFQFGYILLDFWGTKNIPRGPKRTRWSIFKVSFLCEKNYHALFSARSSLWALFNIHWLLAKDAFLCQSSSEHIGGLSSALSGAFMVALLILLSITLITKQSIPSTGAAQEIISFISVRNCRRRIPASRYCKELSRLTSGCPLFPHLIHSILQFTVRVH